MLKKYIILLLLLILALPTVTQAEILWSQNFNDNTTGAYLSAECTADWTGSGFFTARSGYPKPFDDVWIDDTGDCYDGKCLKIRFDEDAIGANSGWVHNLEMNDDYDELYYSYWIKWVNGSIDWQDGKIGGGLSGGVEGTAGWEASGGGPIPTGEDGFSARTAHKTTHPWPYSYVYHPGQTTQYGQTLAWDIGGQSVFTPGTYQHFEIYVKINTAAPGIDCDSEETDDGIIRAYINGVLVAERTNYCFRDNGQAWKINRLHFSNFWGGGIGPNRDEYVYIDDLVVSTHISWSVFNVSPANNDTGVNITAPATWDYIDYVDDVDVWLDKGTCVAEAKTTLVSDDDADKTYDMSTLDESSIYCLVLVANIGAGQGEDQEFEFTTTGVPPPPANLSVIKWSSAAPDAKWVLGGADIKR